MTTLTADALQLHDLFVELTNTAGLPLDTLHVDRTDSHNLTVTVHVRTLQDVEAWAALLDQPVHLAGADGCCVGELAGMACVVTSKAAT